MNRKNLKKLADYLLSGKLQKGFNMSYFENICGTAGCAVGHGPDAGIPKLEGEKWPIYSIRAFMTGLQLSDHKWQWCFSSEWATSETDNTPEGAAKRINWLLEKGLPENWEAQMRGMEPMCY